MCFFTNIWNILKFTLIFTTFWPKYADVIKNFGQILFISNFSESSIDFPVLLEILASKHLSYIYPLKRTFNLHEKAGPK